MGDMLKHITQYALEDMLDDLQKLLKIQDLDIIIHLCGHDEMKDITKNEDNNMGACEIHRERNTYIIHINYESVDETNWFETLIHELFHVVTDDVYYYMNNIYDLIDDRNLAERKQKETDTRIEKLVEKLTCIFINSIDKDFKEKYRIVGDVYNADDEKTK